MVKIGYILLCGLTLLMQGCGQHKEEVKKTEVNESVDDVVESTRFRPYEIGKDEVRDTSFALPRRILDEPEAFMRTLTDIQMINRKWTDTYDYTEKLLFGDSILSKICREIARENKGTVYLTDEISDEENYSYCLVFRKRGDNSYTSYILSNGEVEESSSCKIPEQYRLLVDDWNKKKMFEIGETDEERKKYVMDSGMVLYSELIGKHSGCITRLRCDRDSVYVDMVKLYLWALEEIPDEAEVREILKRKEERIRQKEERKKQKQERLRKLQEKYS